MKEMIKRFDFRTFIGNNGFNWAILIFLFNYYLIHCFVFSKKFSISAFSDGGLFSVLTLYLIMATQFFVIWHCCKAGSSRSRWGFAALAYALEIYALREADFHSLFTARHVTRAKFFIDPNIPFIHQFVAGIIVLPFLAAFLYLLIFHSWPTIKAFLKGEKWAVAFALWGTLLVGSQIADHSAWNTTKNWRLKGIEEMMEFSAAVYALTSILFFTLSGRGKK